MLTTDHLEGLTQPTQSARALGYHTPAEFEPSDALWLTYPHNTDTWPNCFGKACAQYEEFIKQASRFVKVNVIGHGHEFDWETNDSWVRDYGPIFVVKPGARALCDFRFDNWGRKYPGWELDDAVPRHVEKLLGLPRFASEVVLEGGSIDGDGQGTVLTTESCLLNPNRGAGRSREALERLLADFLGARRVLWLGDGIEGDDTDGHIDDLARFVDERTIVIGMEDDTRDPNYRVLRANRRLLDGARDQAGRPFEIVELPMPRPVAWQGTRLPATYMNFLFVNGGLLVPTFGQPARDRKALAMLQRLMPRRKVVGVDCRALIWGLGAIHCLTQQQPVF